MTTSPRRSRLAVDPEELLKTVESLRNRAAFDEGDTKLTPEAEQFYLLAVSSLEMAQRYFKLADYAAMQRR